MMFPHFTPQRLTIDGSWHEESQYLRFTGAISSSAPFVILSLLKHGERYHYMKHDKSDASEGAGKVCSMPFLKSGSHWSCSCSTSSYCS